MLPPSSGWLNLVHVDAEMTGRRKCGDYIRKLARFWANHSYRRGKFWQNSYRVQDGCWSPFRNSDWLQSLQLLYIIDVFPPPVISASNCTISSRPEDGGRTLLRNVQKPLGLQWKNTKRPTVGVFFVVVATDFGSHGTQFKPRPFMSGLLNEACRYFLQSLYAFVVLNVNVWVVIISTSCQGFPDSDVSLETAYHDWGFSSFCALQTSAGILPYEQACTTSSQNHMQFITSMLPLYVVVEKV